MDAHYGHSGSKEVQISGFQLISQEYLDFIQDSNQKRQNQKKSIHRFNRRLHFSIRRLNAVIRVWTSIYIG